MATVTFDDRGCAISATSSGALRAFEDALASFHGWRSGAEQQVAQALDEDPSFTMAHVLRAYLGLCSRDPAKVRAVRLAPPDAGGLAANARERLHLAAIDAVLNDDYELAKVVLGDILQSAPHDLLALNVAHAFDYLTGDLAQLNGRVAPIAAQWSSASPGYASVLSMWAFGLQEVGEFARAEALARDVLQLEPGHVRAHHVLAHVFEASGRAQAGIDWMRQHRNAWSSGTEAASHCWWHVALFYVAQGDFVGALALYDAKVRAVPTNNVADLVDASSLLWRIELAGGDAGMRWDELACAWAPHTGDRFCTFSDIHAMMAFVGARRWNLAAQLERELAANADGRTRHGRTTRQLGLRACRALIAYRRHDFHGVLHQLADLSTSRMGGSHAQRHVLELTRQRAFAQVAHATPTVRGRRRIRPVAPSSTHQQRVLMTA